LGDFYTSEKTGISKIFPKDPFMRWLSSLQNGKNIHFGGIQRDTYIFALSIYLHKFEKNVNVLN